MDSKQFFYEFGRALYHVDAVYEGFAKASGVTSPTLLWILYALNDLKPHTQKELCQSWDLPKSTVNTVVSELKEKRLVTLTPILGKRREMYIALTESGRLYAEQLLKDIYRKEELAYKKLSKTDKEIINTLNKISGLLKA